MNKKGITLILLVLMLSGLFYLSFAVIDPNISNISKENLSLNSEHTFESASDWSETNNWSFSGENVNLGPGDVTKIQVLPTFDQQSDVLCVNDSSVTRYCRVQHNFSTQRTSGLISIYIQVNSTNSPNTPSASLIITSNKSVDYGSERLNYEEVVRFHVSGYLERYNGSGTLGFENLSTNTAYSQNTWYNISIEFDCTLDIIKIYVNGALKSQESFVNAADYFEAFRMDIADPTYKSNAYIAWIDYSWDSGSTGNPVTTPPIPGFQLSLTIFALITICGLIFYKKRNNLPF